MMKKVNAMIFTLMMLTVPLAGCTGDDGPVDVLGCTNADANNYNENVTKDDGSCDYDLDDDGVLDADEILGCMDSKANNYNLEATDEDGSCDYDLDDDGVLDADEVPGCRHWMNIILVPSNYNPKATDDDGSCDFDLDDDGILDYADINITAISAGNHHTCAILDNGSVSCWGNNGQGQLGDGPCDYCGVSKRDRHSPTVTLLITNQTTGTTVLHRSQAINLGDGRTAVAIDAGKDHTCAILDDGSVSCWGYNGKVNLEMELLLIEIHQLKHTSLGEGRTAVAISAGVYHTCAILDDGSVSCWGANGNTPTQTTSLGEGRTAVSIAAGSGHTCAILDDGSVSCWGANGNTPTQTTSPGEGRTPVSIAAGGDSTCLIFEDGTVNCWNSFLSTLEGGGLVDGSTSIEISTNYQHTCAILNNFSVSCWGSNSNGQLGGGNNNDRGINHGNMNDLIPILNFGGIRTVIAITNGGSHTCAMLDDHSFTCWGSNGYGQLGDGTTTDRNTVLADTDNDGIVDYDDFLPLDPTEQYDSDNDGIGNNIDDDDDDDGILDIDEVQGCTNSSISNYNPNATDDDGSCYTDTDNDGVEDPFDTFPLDPNEDTDSDGDGVGDNADAFPLDPSEYADSDGDGVGDNADAFPLDPNEDTDSDGDGVGDNADSE